MSDYAALQRAVTKGLEEHENGHPNPDPHARRPMCFVCFESWPCDRALMLQEAEALLKLLHPRTLIAYHERDECDDGDECDICDARKVLDDVQAGLCGKEATG